MGALRWIPPVAVAIMFMPLFMIITLVITLPSFGLELVPEEVYELFTTNAFCISFMVVSGLVSLLSVIWLFLVWKRSEHWKDLRYKMAFYLYHSRVRRDDVIPLERLAEVALCSEKDITITLEDMIKRGELKGRVDRERGFYIHIGMTGKGVQLALALPPAKLDRMGGIKKEALRDASSREDLPPSSIELGTGTGKSGSKKVRCPACGRMNRGNTHFCTYCGEVI